MRLDIDEKTTTVNTSKHLVNNNNRYNNTIIIYKEGERSECAANVRALVHRRVGIANRCGRKTQAQKYPLLTAQPWNET